MKTVYLIRHGQTLLNHFNKMQGWVDSPLTELGRQQAIAAGKSLADVQFDYAASSDLGRAVETLNLVLAQQISEVPAPDRMEDLREAYFGSFEGLDAKLTWNMIGGPLGYRHQPDLVSKYGILKIRDFMHAADPFHEAETGDQVESRINRSLAHLSDQLLDGQTAVAVSHGTYIRTLATLLTPGHPLMEQPTNGSVTTIDVTDKNHPEIIKYNVHEK